MAGTREKEQESIHYIFHGDRDTVCPIGVQRQRLRRVTPTRPSFCTRRRETPVMHTVSDVNGNSHHLL